MALSGYWDIIIFGVIAAVLLWRLRNILGTRSDADPPSFGNPFEIREKDKEKDKAKEPKNETGSMPKETPASLSLNWAAHLPNYDVVANATAHHRLLPFVSVAPDFRPDDFLDKAKKVFVAVASAYALGDIPALEFLLSPSLFLIFSDQIDKRKTGEVYQAQLHAIKSAVITDAQLDGAQAEITVDFRVEQSILHKDVQGNVIGIYDGAKRLYHDRWVFGKNLKDAADPKWTVLRAEETGQ